MEIRTSAKDEAYTPNNNQLQTLAFCEDGSNFDPLPYMTN